ncbi:MAG: 4a-hydroxytetrahydrobiopterin dehydratase [Asgard group archaeon]|nr:4a-hydroxytetrahydrobiopterin dehydratase [Asgard group archaeon]
MSRRVLPALHEITIRQGLEKINQLGYPHWHLNRLDEPPSHTLHVLYHLKNFKITWEFLNSVAQLAASKKHHPTITTTYDKVDIQLTTHDADNNVTQDDLDMAEAIHKQYQDLLKST